MATFSITQILLSSTGSALAGAAVYHLVANTIERQRSKYSVLTELRRNYRSLQKISDRTRGDSWDGVIHNGLRTTARDRLETRTPKLRFDLTDDEQRELSDLYGLYDYINRLHIVSVSGDRGDLPAENVRSLVGDAQSLTESVYGSLRDRWHVAAYRTEPELPTPEV
ncbi:MULTISPECIES: hypothetical protein [Halobaculum]|uniref:Uncharacterized protein n=2 Tax=Halobaculum TaxID=43927 RepID=A0A8T8W9K3_9EURY|nr:MULTISPECIES: hypothetical protein [Halobaculum]QZP36525.1 hypothetical protein K6T50_09355 [Halobaculum magnesiiphilum]QZY01502.1 hypothetical protein K6T36_09130 [Halobaculum roseum]